MHRRHLLNLSTGLAAWAAVASRLTAAPDPATQVIELDRQLNHAILSHDANAASALYDDDFILTVAGGGTKLKADMLADIRNPAVVLNVCDTSSAKVRVRGNTAVLTGVLRQAGTVSGRAIDVTLNVTDTWVASGNSWVLLAGHASVAKPPAAQR